MSVLNERVLVAGRTLRNRVVATAHGTAAVVDGMPLPSDVAYWGQLARGGPSMVVAGISVGRTSTLRGRFLGEWHAHAAAAYRPKAEAITSAGALAIAPLPSGSRDPRRADLLPVRGTERGAVAPRTVAGSVLTTDDCSAAVTSFVTSACMMSDAGFDGVEIHGAHGYLVAQFLNEHVNDRTDRYGGDVAGRCTLLLEIIAGIRRERPDAIVGLRLSVENDPDGAGLDQLASVVRVIAEREPTDFLDLTYGNRLSYVRDMATTRPPLMDESFADQLRAIRQSAAVPVLLCSSFHDRSDLEQVVDGRADLVGMARPLHRRPGPHAEAARWARRPDTAVRGQQRGLSRLRPSGSVRGQPRSRAARSDGPAGRTGPTWPYPSRSTTCHGGRRRSGWVEALLSRWGSLDQISEWCSWSDPGTHRRLPSGGRGLRYRPGLAPVAGLLRA